MSLAIAFFLHYVDYITAPGILLTIALVFIPTWFALGLGSDAESSGGVPGCRRLGRRLSSPASPSNGDLVYIHPIINGPGIPLSASTAAVVGPKLNGLFTIAESRAAKQRPDATKSSEWSVLPGTAQLLSRFEAEVWIPEPGPSSARSSSSHTRSRSDELKAQGRPRSRNRTTTLTMESAGLDAGAANNPSVPRGQVDWAAQGGCLILRFPYLPIVDLMGLRRRKLAIRVPLSPSAERAKSKAYVHREVLTGDERLSAFDLGKEIDPWTLNQLRRSLGSDISDQKISFFRINIGMKADS